MLGPVGRHAIAVVSNPSWLVAAGCLLGATAGCKGDDRMTSPVTNTVAPAAAPSPVPAGWVELQPSEERRRCANYSRDEWRIAIDGAAVRIEKAAVREPDSGPPLPFALPRLAEVRGRRHVLAAGDGFLVGFDAGEWGGSLYWFDKDGGRQRKLAGENVRGLVALGPDAALALEGLAHMSLDEGRVRWLERRGGAFQAAGETPLPASPQTHVAIPGGAVYVLTTKSLVRVTPDRRVTVVQPVSTYGLYPDSMAIDPGGALWIGMRQLVLRLAPARDRFTETWLVRQDCRRAEQVDLDCFCRGS
jgi:hypothetical protein